MGYNYLRTDGFVFLEGDVLSWDFQEADWTAVSLQGFGFLVLWPGEGVVSGAGQAEKGLQGNWKRAPLCSWGVLVLAQTSRTALCWDRGLAYVAPHPQATIQCMLFLEGGLIKGSPALLQLSVHLQQYPGRTPSICGVSVCSGMKTWWLITTLARDRKLHTISVFLV